MKLRAISGFNAKGPACFLIETARQRLLLDLGAGPDLGRRPNLAGIGPVDAILISHGHPDHVGALDLRADLGNPPVFATDPVRALSAVPGVRDACPLPRRGRIEIAGLPVETGAAGHAPGAVWMRIGGATGLLYTGDLSDETTLFAFEPPAPAAALVFDASYGAEDTPLAEQMHHIRARADAGPVLLPAPAGGRGLEMAAHFLAEGFEATLCPAHQRVAETLLHHGAWLRPGGPEALRRLLDASGTLSPDRPARGVMIAAEPNGDAGISAALISRFARSGEAEIVLTGHIAAGSAAEAAHNAGRARFLRWNVHPRLAAIRTLIATVQPRTAVPAFVGSEGRAALKAALAPALLADTPEIAW